MGDDADSTSDRITPKQSTLRAFENFHPVHVEHAGVGTHAARQVDPVYIDAHARIEIECEVVLSDTADIGCQHGPRSTERYARVESDVRYSIAEIRDIRDALGSQCIGCEGADRDGD